jgi:hypothetical protein
LDKEHVSIRHKLLSAEKLILLFVEMKDSAAIWKESE